MPNGILDPNQSQNPVPIMNRGMLAGANTPGGALAANPMLMRQLMNQRLTRLMPSALPQMRPGGMGQGMGAMSDREREMLTNPQQGSREDFLKRLQEMQQQRRMSPPPTQAPQLPPNVNQWIGVRADANGAPSPQELQMMQALHQQRGMGAMSDAESEMFANYTPPPRGFYPGGMTGGGSR